MKQTGANGTWLTLSADVDVNRREKRWPSCALAATVLTSKLQPGENLDACCILQFLKVLTLVIDFTLIADCNRGWLFATVAADMIDFNGIGSGGGLKWAVSSWRGGQTPGPT